MNWKNKKTGAIVSCKELPGKKTKGFRKTNQGLPKKHFPVVIKTV